MLDGSEIILANWPNDKHIICTTNNDIPVKILSHPHVLVNGSVLCNHTIEADKHYLLESLAACDNRDPKLTMYFMINTAFAHYLDMFPNFTESLLDPLIVIGPHTNRSYLLISIFQVLTNHCCICLLI